MILRPYQERFINNISAKLRIHRKVVAQLATGGGKTVCFAAICDRYCARSTQDVLILVHREELLTQAAKAIRLPVQKVVAGMKTIPPARVYVAMVESAHKRLHLFENIGMVIVDEVHIGNFTKVLDYFEALNPEPPKHTCEYLKNGKAQPTPLVIGFTATPIAARKKYPLKKYFNDIVCGIDIPELIDQGYLCPEQTYSSSSIVNRANLKMQGGEFDAAKMGAIYKSPKFIETTINAYKEHSLNRKTIIFNCNVEHSQAVNAAFIEAGFNSRHLDATSTDRVEILEWFANTPDAILNNIGIATTGFDQPDIETVIVNKATASMPLWLQMCGRGARPHPIKLAFTIIDLGGNCVTHGEWNEVRDWNHKFHYPDKPGEGVAPVKQCPQCNALLHTSKMICDGKKIIEGEVEQCNYEFPKIEVKDEGIQEFILMTDSVDIKKLIKMNEHHKEYRSLFLAIEHVAFMAKKNIKKLNADNYLHIQKKNHEIARLWCRERKRDFNRFHKNLADEKLKTTLKTIYNADIIL
jgi:superfamily II DNA or RNA helicase